MKTVREDLESVRLLVRAANEEPSPDFNAAVLSAIVAVVTRLVERLEEMEGEGAIHRHSPEGDVLLVTGEERTFGRRRLQRDPA